jgi:hypothetical protein
MIPVLSPVSLDDVIVVWEVSPSLAEQLSHRFYQIFAI